MITISRFFRTTSKYANIAVLATLVAWAIKLIVLNKMPEAFSSAYEIGQISEAIFSQIVASYVFYLFFVHTKELTDREQVWPYIIRYSWLIYNDAKQHIEGVAAASGATIDFETVTRREIVAVFSNIPPGSHPNMVVGLGGRRPPGFNMSRQRRVD